MSLMIDWITFKTPFFISGVLNGGKIINTNEHGEIEYTIDKRFSVCGSYDSRLSLKTADVDLDGNTILLSVSGNPVKWFQGHNVFGSSDLHALVCATVFSLSEVLDCPQPEIYRRYVLDGRYSLSRVDINAQFDFSTREDVLSYLNTLGKTSSTRHGKAIFKGSTVYFGKGSKRWSFKFYSKGQEFLIHKPDVNFAFDTLNFLKDYSDTKLRAELTLSQKELKKLTLEIGKSWVVARDPIELYMAYIDKIQVADMIMSDDLTKTLPKRLRSTYTLWNAGNDLRELVSRATFYAHKKELLEFGVDISIPKFEKSEQPTAKILPFRRMIKGQLAVLPPEILNNPELFFNPNEFLKRFSNK